MKVTSLNNSSIKEVIYMKDMKRKKKKGFTLIELIVVIAILGILAAIAIPKFAGIQDTSKIKADAATALQIVNAARVQETNTGTQVANLAALDSSNIVVGNPQSGGTFALTGGGTDPYVVTWTPKTATHNLQQTVTEGSPFVLQ